jgi:hypothetical protein
MTSQTNTTAEQHFYPGARVRIRAPRLSHQFWDTEQTIIGDRRPVVGRDGYSWSVTASLPKPSIVGGLNLGSIRVREDEMERVVAPEPKQEVTVATPKFKVGDKVELAGVLGRVTVIRAGDVRSVTVQWLDGEANEFRGQLVDKLRKVDPVPPPVDDTPPVPVFAICDRVELLGVEGTVVSNRTRNGGNAIVSIGWDDGTQNVLTGALLRQVKKAPPTFITGAWYKHALAEDVWYRLSPEGFDGLYVDVRGKLVLVRSCLEDSDLANVVEVDFPI